MAATILVVEDEHAVARGIQYALQQEGYDVTLAPSGEEGLEIATRSAPDLVLLDVRLPGMDGFEVLRRLRAAGTAFVIDPYVRFRGDTGEQATMFFLDPSGNALEFKAFKDPSQLFAK